MSYFPYRFDAVVARHAIGRYRYTVVYLPADLAAELPFDANPRLRIEADVGGCPVQGAWQPSKGRWYLMLSKPLLRDAGLAVGDAVEVHFRVVAQDAVELPPELAEALARDRAAARGWARLTPGAQRGHAHRIASAKRAATRASRLAAVLAELAEHGRTRRAGR